MRDSCFTKLRSPFSSRRSYNLDSEGVTRGKRGARLGHDLEVTVAELKGVKAKDLSLIRRWDVFASSRGSGGSPRLFFSRPPGSPRRQTTKVSGGESEQRTGKKQYPGGTGVTTNQRGVRGERPALSSIYITPIINLISKIYNLSYCFFPVD